jgi:tRNA pseudouridine55 synthase
MAHDGFCNLLKPPGMTSHDVVALARRRLAMRRVGHLGTLDPATAGVLPLLVGRAVRLQGLLAGADKAYRALLVFGLTTATLDAESEVTGAADASHLEAARLLELLAAMLGEQEQVPPAFSARQVGGKRLYELARRGVAVTAPAKRVVFRQLSLVEFAPGRQATALVEVTCSAGTYVRALADDLGRAAGCGAYLGFLLRTRSGRFQLSDALTLEEFTADPQQALLPADWPLAELPSVNVDSRAAASFAAGSTVEVQAPAAARVKVYCGGQFLGLGAPAEGGLQPRTVLVTPEEVGP